MCGSTEKCCFVVPLHVASVCIGVISFIMPALFASTAIFYLVQELPLIQNSHHYEFSNVLGLSLGVKALTTVSVILLIVALVWMVASVLLIIGVVKNRPSFVLFFFMIGVLIVILGLLAGILVLIQNSWQLATAVIVATLVYIHFVEVTYYVYERMLQGKVFQRQDSEQDLLTAFDYNTLN